MARAQWHTQTQGVKNSDFSRARSGERCRVLVKQRRSDLRSMPARPCTLRSVSESVRGTLAGSGSGTHARDAATSPPPPPSPRGPRSFVALAVPGTRADPAGPAGVPDASSRHAGNEARAADQPFDDVAVGLLSSARECFGVCMAFTTFMESISCSSTPHGRLVVQWKSMDGM